MIRYHLLWCHEDYFRVLVILKSPQQVTNRDYHISFDCLPIVEKSLYNRHLINWSPLNSLKLAQHRKSTMNSSLIVILLVALATMQVEAFMPSSVRPSTLLRSLRTRLQFKNFDEMLEQLDVPVLVDFYGKNASHSLYISNATNVTTLQRPCWEALSDSENLKESVCKISSSGFRLI